MRSQVGARARDRGSASVELVVLFPALLALLFIVVQAGLHYYARSVALAAAQEGARAAAAQSATAAAGQDAASAFVAKAGSELLPGAQVSATRTADQVTVSVTGTSLSLVPGYAGFPIVQVVSAPVEKVT